MIKRTFIEQKSIIEIDEFLSGEMCQNLISKRQNSFSKARSHYPNYYRNNNMINLLLQNTTTIICGFI